ncbi:Fungal specific transcription factor domain-containing protein [Cladophialophora immunda]|nr:Fungal specific transcription factor domain-containing protein [Cladophialophora immunda]
MTATQQWSLIRDGPASHTLLYSLANMSFLEDVQKLVQGIQGNNAYVSDTWFTVTFEACYHQHLPIEPIITVEKLGLEDATHLAHWYSWTTQGILDIFDGSELLEQLPKWLEEQPLSQHPLDAIFHMVMAIGLQTSPQDRDDAAEKFFRCAYWKTLSSMEESSITALQASTLITWYLLCSGRRNAAFLHIGLCVQAAHALNLHREEVSALLSPSESRKRERIWKTIRILDGYMGTTLGRPPLTYYQLLDDRHPTTYSASYSLIDVFSVILREVINRRHVSENALNRVSHLLRMWTSCLPEGLANDQIQSVPEINTKMGKRPNIGLLHLKQSYYFTIILATRHYLLERVCSRALLYENAFNRPATQPERDTLVDACLYSAMCTVKMFEIFLTAEDRPKRLHMIIHGIFVSALVLGVGHFGDLDLRFPIDQSLAKACELLDLFGRRDSLAQTSKIIVDGLQIACKTYVRTRNDRSCKDQLQQVKRLFGDVESQTSLVEKAESPAAQPQPPPNFEEPVQCAAPEYRSYPMVESENQVSDFSLNPLPALSHTWQS